jgi:hypothetical protein
MLSISGDVLALRRGIEAAKNAYQTFFEPAR